MRIRLRKGTREWLVELANITLGVLIALGLGEAVGDWNAGRDVTNARAAMVFETSKNVGQAIGRERVAGCVERRLDTLAAIVDKAGITGRLPPVGDIASPPIAAWPTTAWASIGSETRAHMERPELVARGSMALFAGLIAQTNQSEVAAWTRLYTLVGPGRRIGEWETAELRAAIGEARSANRSMLSLAWQYRGLAAGMHAPVELAQVRRYADRIDARVPICRPIDGTVPAHYENAPFAHALVPRR